MTAPDQAAPTLAEIAAKPWLAAANGSLWIIDGTFWCIPEDPKKSRRQEMTDQLCIAQYVIDGPTPGFIALTVGERALCGTGHPDITRAREVFLVEAADPTRAAWPDWQDELEKARGGAS